MTPIDTAANLEAESDIPEIEGGAPLEQPAKKIIEKNYLWLPELGIAYGRIPKAANTSIRDALLQMLNLDLDPELALPNKDDFWKGLPKSKASMLTKKQLLSHPETRNAWVFSFVREPFSRLYSCWNNKVIENETLSRQLLEIGVVKGMTFETFVETVCNAPDEGSDVHVRSQASFLTLGSQLLPHFVGRVETMDSDWTHLQYEVRLRSGHALPEIARRNARAMATPDISEQYPLELRQMVARRYQRDYELFYPERLQGVLETA
jgi:hypothetical protein